ncbi:hypothetical protein [Thermococcus atlanticus]
MPFTGGDTMLARIVYYREDSLPLEFVVAAGDEKRAKEIAEEKLKEVQARGFEVEMIA